MNKNHLDQLKKKRLEARILYGLADDIMIDEELFLDILNEGDFGLGPFKINQPYEGCYLHELNLLEGHFYTIGENPFFDFTVDMADREYLEVQERELERNLNKKSLEEVTNERESPQEFITSPRELIDWINCLEKPVVSMKERKTNQNRMEYETTLHYNGKRISTTTLTPISEL